MATVQENLATLGRYFETGGELGPPSNTSGIYEAAMRELIWDGGSGLLVSAATARATREACAKAQLWENTLSAPSLSPDLFVRPNLQIILMDGLHRIATGGGWSAADPAGVTPWLGTEGGSQYTFEAALTDPPRTYNGQPFALPPTMIASALRLIRDAGMPVLWIKRFHASRVFEALEVRAAASTWTTTERRIVLALAAQAKARIETTLATLALSDATGGFPSFPTGDGKQTPTAPSLPRPWYSKGWTWAAAAAGAVSGGLAARRR